MRLKADLSLFAVAVIWGTAFITQGVAAQNQLAFLFNGVSFILGSIILLPLIPRGQKIPAAQSAWMLVAGTLLFIASALQQVGIFYTQVANAGFITSLYIVFIPFILWIGFREKPHWIDLAAVSIAAAGAYLLSTAGSFHIQPGDGLELAGAVFWGLHLVVLGKYASRFEPVSFAAGQFLVGGLFNLLIGLSVENPGKLLLLPVLGAILYRSIFSISIGYTLQVWGQRHTPPTDAALILGLESVFAAVSGWMILNQNLLPIQILGCAIIFVAVILSQLKNLVQSTAHPEGTFSQ